MRFAPRRVEAARLKHEREAVAADARRVGWADEIGPSGQPGQEGGVEACMQTHTAYW